MEKWVQGGMMEKRGEKVRTPCSPNADSACRSYTIKAHTHGLTKKERKKERKTVHNHDSWVREWEVFTDVSTGVKDNAWLTS